MAADLFCGAGGESTGMIMAADKLGMRLDLLAVNHWEIAVETHSRNHPDAHQLCESIQSIDPLAAIPGGRPLSTVLATNPRHALVEPLIVKYYGSGGGVHPVSNALHTVATKDRFGLLTGDVYELDIRFRMLMPHELAAAQGFPSDYWFAGNKTEQVKQIGNAVPVNTAKALCEAVLAA